MIDFAKATKKQLYQIAMDENNRLRDRYLAAKELWRRKKEKK
jgi:hypothetical protein